MSIALHDISCHAILIYLSNLRILNSKVTASLHSRKSAKNNFGWKIAEFNSTLQETITFRRTGMIPNQCSWRATDKTCVHLFIHSEEASEEIGRLSTADEENRRAKTPTSSVIRW